VARGGTDEEVVDAGVVDVLVDSGLDEEVSGTDASTGTSATVDVET
jgi:hypothetical protein